MPQSVEDIRRAAEPILVRLALVSEAPAGRIDAMPRTHGTPEHRKPTGNSRPVAEELADRLNSSETMVVALSIYAEARRELGHALRRAMAVDATETAGELAERIVEDGEGWTVDDVSLAMRCPHSFVRRARLEFGRDPETGAVPAGADPMEIARRLHAEGRSWRSISTLTGVPRSTLFDRLGR